MIEIPEKELAEIVAEAEGIFLGLSSVFQGQMASVTESPAYSRKRVFFRPLDRRALPESELYCTRVLRILVEQCRSTGGSDHLFLKNTSPSLRLALESDAFGDTSPLIVALAEGLPRLYLADSNSKGPFWRIKALVEFRAQRETKSRSRNYIKLAKAIFRAHQEENLGLVIL